MYLQSFMKMRNGDVKTVNSSNGLVTLPCRWLIIWRQMESTGMGWQDVSVLRHNM